MRSAETKMTLVSKYIIFPQLRVITCAHVERFLAESVYSSVYSLLKLAGKAHCCDESCSPAHHETPDVVHSGH